MGRPTMEGNTRRKVIIGKVDHRLRRLTHRAPESLNQHIPLSRTAHRLCQRYLVSDILLTPVPLSTTKGVVGSMLIQVVNF